MLYKQVSWYDRKDRAPGIISNLFCANIQSINGMSSETIVTIIELTMVALVGVTIGMIVSPVSAIMALLFSPIIIGGSYMSATITFKKKGRRDEDVINKIDDFQAANALLLDVIINYRTVISFG